MFEKLNRARADFDRNVKKLAEAQKKYDESAARLKKIETATILDLVKMRSLTPEQLAKIVGGEELPIPTESALSVDATGADSDHGDTKIFEEDTKETGEEKVSFADAKIETEHEDEEDILNEVF